MLVPVSKHAIALSRDTCWIITTTQLAARCVHLPRQDPAVTLEVLGECGLDIIHTGQLGTPSLTGLVTATLIARVALQQSLGHSGVALGSSVAKPAK